MMNACFSQKGVCTASNDCGKLKRKQKGNIKQDAPSKTHIM
jgi:hypothetical protein